MINPLQRDKNSISHGALKNKIAFRSQSRKIPFHKAGYTRVQNWQLLHVLPLVSQTWTQGLKETGKFPNNADPLTNTHSLFSRLFHFYLLIVAARTKRWEPGPWTVGYLFMEYGISLDSLSALLTCPHLTLSSNQQKIGGSHWLWPDSRLTYIELQHPALNTQHGPLISHLNDQPPSAMLILWSGSSGFWEMASTGTKRFILVLLFFRLIVK